MVIMRDFTRCDKVASGLETTYIFLLLLLLLLLLPVSAFSASSFLTTTYSNHAETDFLTTTNYILAMLNTHFLTFTHYRPAKCTLFNDPLNVVPPSEGAAPSYGWLSSCLLC
jgi:hypothetical protein